MREARWARGDAAAGCWPCREAVRHARKWTARRWGRELLISPLRGHAGPVEVRWRWPAMWACAGAASRAARGGEACGVWGPGSLLAAHQLRGSV